MPRSMISSLREWNEFRRTNVDGLIHVTRAVVTGMKQRRYGRIVNLSSIAGHGTTLPGNAFYAATKAAVIVLTRRFAMELGPYGITVNAIAPGFILTDMVKEGRTDEEYKPTDSDHQRPFDAGTCRQSGRHCPRRRVPGSSGIRLHHRPDVDGGWRPDGLHRPFVIRRRALRFVP